MGLTRVKVKECGNHGWKGTGQKQVLGANTVMTLGRSHSRAIFPSICLVCSGSITEYIRVGCLSTKKYVIVLEARQSKIEVPVRFGTIWG